MKKILLLAFTISITINIRSQSCGTVKPANYPIFPASVGAGGECLDSDAFGVGNDDFTIPVIFHILRDGPDNEASGWAPDILPLLHTYLDQIYNPLGIYFNYFNSPNIIEDSEAYYSSQVPTSFDICGYLNIYLVKRNENDLGGKAKIGEFSCVVWDESYDDNGFSNILGHEVGHTLGLLHTFQGNTPGIMSERNSRIMEGSCECNCAEEGDMVCDTPPDPNDAFTGTGWSEFVDADCFIDWAQCDTSEDSGVQPPVDECGIVIEDSQELPIIRNIMSYWDFNTCEANQITHGQKLKMKNTIALNESYFSDQTEFDEFLPPVIENSITYNNQVLYTSGLTIREGAKLILNGCTVFVAENAEIMVDGELELIGTNITKEGCGDNWHGFNVNGKIKILENSLIEYVNVAITSVENQNHLPIKLVDSQFKSFRTAIDLNDVNMSDWVDNVVFETDLTGTSIIKLNQAKDFCMRDCQILAPSRNNIIESNQTNIVFIEDVGEAKIECNSFAFDIQNSTKVKIEDADIICDKSSIYINNLNQLFLKRNTIVENQDEVTSVELRDVVNHEIVDNDFDASPNHGPILTITRETSDITNNIVLNNSFTGGFLAIATGGDQGEGDVLGMYNGIQFNCNATAQNSTLDFGFGGDIAPVQAGLYDPNGTTIATGNNLGSEVSTNIDYVGFLNVDYYDDEINTPSVNGNIDIFSGEENFDCSAEAGFVSDGPPEFTDGSTYTGVNDQVFGTTGDPELDIDIIDNQIQLMTVNLQDSYDNSDTEELVNYVENNIQTNTEAVLDSLNSVSPSISPAVIIAILDNSQYITEQEAVTLLVDNSHVLYNSYIAALCAGMSFSVPSKEQIRNATTSNQTIDQLLYHIFKANTARDAIIRYGLNQEWSKANPNYNKVLFWLEKSKTINGLLWSAYYIYTSKGVNAVESYISSKDNLNMDERKKLNLLLKTCGMFDKLALGGTLEQSDLSFIRTYSADTQHLIGNLCRSLCSTLNLEGCKEPDNISKKPRVYFKNVVKPRSKSEGFNNISIFPNPTEGVIYIKLNDKDCSKVASIKMKNIYGQGIIEHLVTDCSIQLNTNDKLKSGVYYLTIYNFDKKIIKTQKIFIK